MEPFILKGTDISAQVILDPGNGNFELSGRSYPDNVIEFFTPVYRWLNEYAKDPLDKTVFNFRMEYFNTASAKVILDIMTHFEEMIEEGHQVLIRWHFTAEDEDMQKAGEEYANMVDVPFEMVLTDIDASNNEVD